MQRSAVTPNSNVERQLSQKLYGGSGSGRDSRSRLAALPRRCELEVSVRPSAVGRGYISISRERTGPNPLEWPVYVLEDQKAAIGHENVIRQVWVGLRPTTLRIHRRKAAVGGPLPVSRRSPMSHFDPTAPVAMKVSCRSTFECTGPARLFAQVRCNDGLG